jgi:capsular exopolysaccharide synthesis family protein
VDELQRQVATQRQSVVSELSTNYRAAKEREKLLKGEVRAATTDLATLAQYDALKREVQADRQLYDSLYAKIKEAGISAASKSSNIHIVNQARVLDHPTRPHRALNILAGVLTGLIGGVVLAFVKDRWEDRIYTTEDIRASAGLPSITVVPVIQASHNKTAIWDRAGTSLALPRTERPGYPVGPDCFVLQRPNAPESEAVHTLWTMLFLSHSGNCPKTILITSPLPGEGKTTLVNNLAVALTNHGRTCLVDADLRKPMVSTRFKLSAVTGLEHYLQGTATLNQIKCSSEVKNLTIVPSIKATDGAIQLLTGDAIRTLVAGLREQFDFVIIDTPPILPYADGLALSTLVDGVILVGRAGQTPRGAVMRGIELLGSVNSAPILAVVLNAANQRPDYSGYSNRFAFE